MTFKGKKISVVHISVFSLSIPKAINNNTGLRCGHLTNGLHLSPVKISDLKLRIAGFLKNYSTYQKAQKSEKSLTHNRKEASLT